MNNFRRSLRDNTNRHALILTHSLSRFTFPRCVLHSDNPWLWDIQLSSRDFCEIIAKVMSLIRWLFSWFQSFTRTTRRLLWQQTSGHHALVTNDDFSRLQVTIHALVTKLQATLVRPTPHMRVLHALSLWQEITDTTDRAILTIATLFFPHGENTRLDTHTQTHSATAVTTYATFDFRDSSSVRSSLSSTPRYFPEAYLKLLAFQQCHQQLRRLLSYELFCQYYSSRLFHVSLNDLGKIKVLLSISAFVTFIQSPAVSHSISQRQVLTCIAFYSIRSCPLCLAISTRLAKSTPRPSKTKQTETFSNSHFRKFTDIANMLRNGRDATPPP